MDNERVNRNCFLGAMVVATGITLIIVIKSFISVAIEDIDRTVRAKESSIQTVQVEEQNRHTEIEQTIEREEDSQEQDLRFKETIEESDSDKILQGGDKEFDAKGYVNGVLKNIYLGDSAGYRDFVNITEEEAYEEYEQGIRVEADFFLQYYGLDDVSDVVYQQITDMYKELYLYSKFDVKEAVKNGNDFFVEVLISPIDIIINSEDDITDAVNEFIDTANPDEYADQVAVNDALGQLVVDVIKKNLSNLGYQDQRSVIVKVEMDAYGYYGLSKNAINLLDQDMIAY